MLGDDPLEAGLRLMPWTATLMVCAPIAGRLTDRYGERAFVAGGLLLQALGMGWITAVSAAGHPGYPDLLPPLLVGGVGLTMAMPAAQKAVVAAVRPAEAGRASGPFTMLRILGGVFGVAVTVALFAGVGGYASVEEFRACFTAAMCAVTAFASAGALIALGMPGRRPRPAAVVAGAGFPDGEGADGSGRRSKP